MPLPKPTKPAAVDAVPTPVPQRSDRVNFAARGDAMMTWFPDGVTGINTGIDYLSDAADYVEEQANNADASATTAATQAGTATTQAGIAATQAGIATTKAGDATTQAGNAATSAAQAAVYAAALSGSSSSSVAIATGAKSFTASTGKQWTAGQFLQIASTANNANFMHGTVTSYDSGTGALVMNVTDIGGSGTLADWLINVSGTQGPTGATGATGPAAPQGLVLLAVASASNSAAIDFTSLIDSTYDEYEIHFQNVVPVSASQLQLRTSSNAGSSFDAGASDYIWVSSYNSSGATTPSGTGSTADTKVTMAPINASNTASHGGISGVLTLHDPAGTASNKQVSFETRTNDSATSQYRATGGGGRVSTSAVNAVRLMMSTGNIASGKFKLYGLRKTP